ncbi:hypothetical protein [Brevundimonas diminuta]|uniref:hypothetical protein n=1 Tax=Brevundimonas diminuta TaxID=293 RepID=UPI0011BF9FF8|nr:hypothetical protein [Brevundimonas diminuta]
MTDPARELAELCERLQVRSSAAGETFLAGKFGVEAWSKDFFQILFVIAERCALVQAIVETLEIDEDYRAGLIANVADIMEAFSSTATRSAWQSHGLLKVGAVNVGPLKAISGLVRQQVAYRKLSDAEIEELDVQVAALSDWLKDHQLSEQDFIRQALIEGLEHLRFRMARLTWLGWGYTLESLREVISAYMLLERGGIDPKQNPEAAVMLQKVGTVIKAVYDKVSAAKSVAETGDWLIRAYGAGTLLYQTGKPVIRGLIGVG